MDIKLKIENSLKNFMMNPKNANKCCYVLYIN